MSNMTARRIALDLTAWPSVSETVEETRFAGQFADYLSFLDKAWLAPIPGDPLARANVFGLKRGRTGRTVVLTGHFDTVPFDDYGALADLALQPDRLTAAIIAKLNSSGASALALADLASGDFLAGRGLLDMKGGLAAGLSAMMAYHGDVTLLFLGVSDEEVKSAGARAAVQQLKTVALEHDLDIHLMINLDAISDQGDGALGRVVNYGSIGKQLLFAYAIGKQAHAGYPQDGVNAAYIASELIRAIELAPEFGETTGSEVAALPTTLYSKDLKQGYNVTTPGRAFMYWNTMQHRRSGAEVLEIAMQLAAQALENVRYKTGHEVALRTYASLGVKVAAQPSSASLPDQTCAVLDALSFDRPTVILGFGSIPYPAVQLHDLRLRHAISSAVLPYRLGELNYFAGISDMSFFGEASDDLSVVAANTPIWGSGFTMAEPAGFPIINIGPWGRDYHHWLERIHVGHAFDTLPRVLLDVIEAVAKSG